MLLFLALFPPLFIIYKIYKLDKYEQEPLKEIIITFILGCLTAVPVLIVSPLINSLLEIPYTLVDLLCSGLIGGAETKTLIYTFIGIALVEEYFKFLVLTKYSFKRECFNEPMDGIVYGVIASMGFALIENIIYVYGNTEQSFFVAIVRMFSAIPAHALMGVIMGYYVGKAKFDIQNRKTLMLKGLFGAILLHGAYDYFLFSDLGIGIFAIFSLIFSYKIAKKAIKESQESSPFK
jgi:RsiW-degrading membrane proteinase PrsW (M82 family)